MRGTKIKYINKFLDGLQEAAEMSDAHFKNVRKNVKRQVTRSSLPTIEALGAIDVNRLIIKARQVHG